MASTSSSSIAPHIRHYSPAGFSASDGKLRTIDHRILHSPPADCGIIEAAALGDINKLKEKRKEIGDDRKFRRLFDSEFDTFGYKVLHAVAGLDRLDVCEFLVEKIGVDVDVKSLTGETPLFNAVKGGHVLTANYLIEHGADITTTDFKGYTALHCAFLEGFEPTSPSANKELLVSILLEKGADIEADSVAGTPLHCAAKSGNADIVELLLQNNAEPNSVSKFLGTTPLVSAIYANTNAVKCVELLLEADADPNKLANGLSPLAHAVEAKSNSCIKSLLAAGADRDLVTSCGLRPILHATLAGNLDAVKMLHRARRWSRDASNTESRRINGFEAIKMRHQYIRNLKQRGDDAWDKRDYSSAIAAYTEAIHHNPRDEKLLANRSICWVRMGEGVFALQDAKACVGLKPDWSKAHLREANAWHLLKNYGMSTDAFKRAMELAPENTEIEE